MIDFSATSVKPFGTVAEATEFLESIREAMGVRHLSYWCVSYSEGSPDEVTWVSTYDPAYMNHYMSSYTPAGDPVFDLEVDFVDWATINAEDASAQLMQDQAARFGIARNGITYRFKDEPNLRILFSANVECSDADWPFRRDELVDPMFKLAHNFHRRCLNLVDSRRMAA